jgi:hypothetical protein
MLQHAHTSQPSPKHCTTPSRPQRYHILWISHIIVKHNMAEIQLLLLLPLLLLLSPASASAQTPATA